MAMVCLTLWAYKVLGAELGRGETSTKRIISPSQSTAVKAPSSSYFMHFRGSESNTESMLTSLSPPAKQFWKQTYTKKLKWPPFIARQLLIDWVGKNICHLRHDMAHKRELYALHDCLPSSQTKVEFSSVNQSCLRKISFGHLLG